MELNRTKMKQYGVIVFSDNMNRDKWLADARAKGYTLMIRDGYVELWK